MFAQTVQFDDRTRLYAIRIAGQAANKFQVVSFSGHEVLSDLYHYTVDLVSTDAGIPLTSLAGRQAALQITLADGSRAVRSGYINVAELIESDGGLAAYRINLVPWFWLATQASRNRIFQEKTVVQIFEEVVAAYSPRIKWRTTEDVDGFLADVRPRSYCVQYRESDYAFLSRLLAEEGLGFTFAELVGADATKQSNGSQSAGGDIPEPGPDPQHELVIFSDSQSLPEDYSSLHQNGGRGIRYHRAAAREEQDAIQAFGGLRQLQPAVTTLASYDYKAKSVVGAELGTHHEFAGKTLSAQASRLETYDYVGPYAFASRDEAEHYALIHREAYEARNKTRIGQSSVRTFRPGLAFNLTESPLDEQGKDTKKRFLLTEIDHAGYNNLPSEVMERAAQLIDDDWVQNTKDKEQETELMEAAKEHGYANRFNGIRADVPWRPILADGTGARLNPRPTAQGVQSAIVVGPNGETSPSGADELYTDKLGRIKVRFHWQRAETDQDRATCWLRLASRNAGPGYGAQWIPRIGQEVLIGFLEADIDRPIVLGALYNGQGEAGTAPTPGGESKRQSDPSLYGKATDHGPAAQGNLAGGNSPAWHAAAPGDDAHRNAGAHMGFKTKEFGGSGYNQLVFDDSDNQLRTQLATTQAFTQLNLGHLIHQADNYRGSFRGTGYELRTDAYGVIRAADGLMLTSYGIGVADPAGDNAAAIALSKQAANLIKTYSQAAGTHQTVKLAGNEGSTAANQSNLDEQAAPLPALVKSISGMVDGKTLDQAQADAAAKNTSTADKLPHMADPMIAVTAKAGLGMTAGQSLQWANGENIHWASGENTNLAVGNQLRVHTGQAIGMLAGAIQPGEGAAGTGLTIIAAQGKIDIQAQSDTISVQAKDEVNVQSANAHIDWAAAKRIVLKTAGGACIDISGGNITVKCPGTITVQASQKSFSGPTQLSRESNTWPKTTFDKDVVLKLHTGEPAANRKFEIHREDGAILHGTTDSAGRTGVQQSQLIGQYKVVIVG
jgi:Rhs element Vgr protein